MDKRKRNPDNPFGFTDREYELLQITCAGLTTVEASAMALRISPRTVRTMRTSMIAKVAAAIPGTQDITGVILGAVANDVARAQCFPSLFFRATVTATIERNITQTTNPAGVLSKAAFEAIYLDQDKAR